MLTALIVCTSLTFFFALGYIICQLIFGVSRNMDWSVYALLSLVLAVIFAVAALVCGLVLWLS